MGTEAVVAERVWGSRYSRSRCKRARVGTSFLDSLS